MDSSADGKVFNGLIVTAVAADLLVSFLFAGIAICMVFTLETEDRTSMLLFQFAPTWWQVMAGKMTTVFLSVVALLLTVFLVDGLIVWLILLTNTAQLQPWNPKVWDVALSNAWPLTIAYAAAMLFALQMTMCCAFLFRKVIGAVLVTLFSTLFLCVPLSISVFEQIEIVSVFEHIGIVGLTVFVIITSTSTGLLSLAWHRGILPLRMITQAGVGTAHIQPESFVPSLWQKVWRETAVTPSLHGWISAVSRQQESWWRMASALCWKEIRSGCVFLLICGLLGCFLIVITQGAPNIGFRLLVLCALGGLFCLECGHRTFRQERSDGSLLFTGHRGADPFLVWSVKAGFWLTATLVGLNLALVLDRCFPMIDFNLDSGSIPGQPVGSIPWILKRIQTAYGWHDAAGSNFFSVSSIPLTCTLICFVSGLAASCWIRRSVLSFTFALCLVTALLTSLGRCMVSDLPVHRLLWPLLLVWFVATATTAGATLEFRRTWKLDAARFGLLLIPALLAWWAAGILRLSQVPDVVRTGNPVVFGVPADSSPLLPWLNPQKTNSAEPANDSANDGSGPSVRTAANPLSFYIGRDFDLRIKVEFDKLRALSDDDIITGFNQSWRRQVARYEWDSYRIAETAIDCSREYSTVGKHQEAGRCLTDGVRLIRVLNQVSVNWDEWNANNGQECRLLRVISLWAADDAVSPDDLRATQSHLRMLTQKEVSPAAMLNNRYHLLELIQKSPSIVDTKRFNFIKFPQWNQLSSTEKARLVKVLRLITAITLDEFDVGTELTWRVSDTTAVPSDSRKFLQRILRSMKGCGLNLDKDPMLRADFESFEESGVVETLRQTTTLERATRLILELQAYRRRFGEFPRSLDILMSGDWLGKEQPLQADTVVSAAGEQFGYSAAGAGFAVAIPHDSMIRVIAPNQPLLWSRSHPAAIDSMTRKNIDPAFFQESVQSGEIDLQQAPEGSLPSAQWTANDWSNKIHRVPADTKAICLEW